MTDDERFDRLATAIERIADVTLRIGERVDQVAQAQLSTQHQIGFLSAEILRLNQRQAEQDQRFDVLLGEIRHIVRRLDEGSQT